MRIDDFFLSLQFQHLKDKPREREIIYGLHSFLLVRPSVFEREKSPIRNEKEKLARECGASQSGAEVSSRAELTNGPGWAAAAEAEKQWEGV